jgi:hypothetical protein
MALLEKMKRAQPKLIEPALELTPLPPSLMVWEA